MKVEPMKRPPSGSVKRSADAIRALARRPPSLRKTRSASLDAVQDTHPDRDDQIVAGGSLLGYKVQISTLERSIPMRWVAVIGVILVVSALAAGAVAISKATDEGTVQRLLLEGSEKSNGLLLDDNGGDAAPNFAGTDVLTGEEIALEDFAGKPVVISVWASWCPDCQEQAQELYSFARAHPEAQILGINISDTLDQGKAFHRENRWYWPSVFDDDASIATELGLDGLPATIFLNADHVIVARLTGMGDVQRFERGLQEALLAG